MTHHSLLYIAKVVFCHFFQIFMEIIMQAIGKFFTSYWPIVVTGVVGVGSGIIACNGFKKTWNSFTGLFTKSEKDKE